MVSVKKRDWKKYNEELVRRGELFLSGWKGKVSNRNEGSMHERYNIALIGSNEVFDFGLVEALCLLGYHVSILRVNTKNKDNVGTKNYIYSEIKINKYTVKLLEIFDNNYLEIFLRKIVQESSIIIVSKSVPIEIHINLILIKLINVVKSLLNREKIIIPSCILWYRPSPAYIFKLSYLFSINPSIFKKIKILFKGAISVLFNILLTIIYRNVIVSEFATFNYLRLFNPNVLILMPYVPTYIDERISSRYNPTGSVFASIYVKREGYASEYEKRYLKLLSILAKAVKEKRFIIAGCTEEDIEHTLGKNPDNIIAVGWKLSNDYYDILAHACAVFAYIEIPGNSNRIAESIAYGKPLITSRIGCQYHPGLKHLHTAMIMDLNVYSIISVADCLKNDDLLQKMNENLKILHKAYLKWNIKQLEKYLNNLFNLKKKASLTSKE